MSKYALTNTHAAFVVLLGWLIILTIQPLSTVLYKYKAANAPQFTVLLEFIQYPKFAKPSIRYTRISRSDQSGIWNAWVETRLKRTCGGDGNGSYPIDNSGTQEFTWSYFLGKDCPVPDEPFRVCSNYTLADGNTGITLPYGPYCTGWRNEG